MNYLLLFLRNFKRNKLFTLLNLFGLIIGVSAFIYMTEYIRFERSYEDFNESAGQVYRITSQKTQNGEVQERKSCAPVVLKPFLLANYPEVEYAARVHILDVRRLIISVKSTDGTENTFVEKAGYHAEKDFFKLFGTKLLIGNAETALENPNSIVLTQSLSKKYFGSTNPIGKVITLTDDFRMEYEITGVVEDVPANSHFQYDLLISFETFVKQRPHWRWQAWDWDYFHTYVKLKEGTDPQNLEKNISASIAEVGRDIFKNSGYSMDFELQNIADIHLTSFLGRELHTNANGERLSYLEIMAYFILILAWINFVNLSTAISNMRAKEIGVRKVIGATKSGLTFQYLMEAFLYNLFAALGSLVLIYFANPYLQNITNFSFSVEVLYTLRFWFILFTVVLLGTIGAGLYPSLVLTNMNAVKVLKGNYSSSKQGTLLRKILIMFQFSIAMLLISMTIGIYKQVNSLSQRDLGLDIDRVLVTNMPNIRNASFWSDYDNLKNTLLEQSNILEITASNEVPGTYINIIELFKQRHQNRDEAQLMKFVWVDYDFFSLYNLQISAGGNFMPDNMTDVRHGVILNEEATKILGYDNAVSAIEEPIDWVHSWGTIENYKVIGVIKNYEQEANANPEPMVYVMNRPQTQWYETNYISIKIGGSQNINETIDRIGKIHKEIYSNDSFNFFFLDDHYNRLYQSDIAFGQIFGFFSLLTLSITTLGLFGLTAFLVLNRRKEVSIRRVLGARFKHLFSTFSKTYLLQIGVSFLISTPLSYLFLSIWMNKFIHKMDLTTEVFIAPVAVIVIITIITVLYHLIQTISQNPAEVINEN